MNRNKLYGLDLFSGVGGNSIALGQYVNTITYCEQDKYAQHVLLSRMSEGKLSNRPIWDDVRTLKGTMLPAIDIIVGGFPCQDISVAGNGAGLAGKRSGLFFEIIRLTKEINPPFVFLENVPAIRTRGLREVIRSFTDIGYDCRWTCISAAEVGAPHLRKRWFLLAHSKSMRNTGNIRELHEAYEISSKSKEQHKNETGQFNPTGEYSKVLANCKRDGSLTSEIRGSTKKKVSNNKEGKDWLEQFEGSNSSRVLLEGSEWWAVEPSVGRVANGLPFRVDRIKCLGNAVVPIQAKTAFERLMGLQ